MKNDPARITLRIPAALHGMLNESATTSGRSLNAEIINRLQSTYEGDDKELAQRLRDLADEIERHSFKQD